MRFTHKGLRTLESRLTDALLASAIKDFQETSKDLKKLEAEIESYVARTRITPENVYKQKSIMKDYESKYTEYVTILASLTEHIARLKAERGGYTVEGTQLGLTQ